MNGHSSVMLPAACQWSLNHRMLLPTSSTLSHAIVTVGLNTKRLKATTSSGQEVRGRVSDVSASSCWMYLSWRISEMVSLGVKRFGLRLHSNISCVLGSGESSGMHCSPAGQELLWHKSGM